MRISDWSSDVCSSDLPAIGAKAVYHRLQDSAGQRGRVPAGEADAVEACVHEEPQRSVVGAAAICAVEALQSLIQRQRAISQQCRPLLAPATRNDGRVDPVDQRLLIREVAVKQGLAHRSEEHTSELQSLMRTPYAVFCLTK